MNGLIARLREAIDATEQLARRAGSNTWTVRPGARYIEGDDIVIYDEGGHTSDQAAHIVRHAPAAVLRRCEADRRILTRHKPVAEYPAPHPPSCDACLQPGYIGVEYSADWAAQDWPCPEIRDLAHVYGIEVPRG